MNKQETFAGAFMFSLAIAVVLGAFGTHVLEAHISAKYIDIYETASFYHFVHSIGGLIVIQYLKSNAPNKIKTISIIFLLGILLFSGSLYILSIHEIFSAPGLRKLGAITPIGGLLFIIAWSYAGWLIVKK